jgi:hypothetical protein
MQKKQTLLMFWRTPERFRSSPCCRAVRSSIVCFFFVVLILSCSSNCSIVIGGFAIPFHVFVELCDSTVFLCLRDSVSVSLFASFSAGQMLVVFWAEVILFFVTFESVCSRGMLFVLQCVGLQEYAIWFPLVI